MRDYHFIFLKLINIPYFSLKVNSEGEQFSIPACKACFLPAKPAIRIASIPSRLRASPSRAGNEPAPCDRGDTLLEPPD
jgi:hypothetical protein